MFLNDNNDIEFLFKDDIIKKSKFINKILDNSIIEEFISKYPNKSWNWDWILKNTNINIEKYIPLDIIEKYKNKWRYYFLSYNENITQNFIFENLDKKWNIDYLIENNKINNFNYVPLYKYIKLKIIDKYPDKPWNWEWLIENTKINIEKYIPLNIIEKYKYKLNYHILSKNPNITQNFIFKHLNEKWNIDYLIENNKINDFNYIPLYKYIKLKIINKYPYKPWKWEYFQNNSIDHDILEEYISMELIKKYEYRWDYWKLSKNTNFTKEFILKYPNKSWNIKELLNNGFNVLTYFKNINQYIIDKYPNKSWDWEWLIENTDIKVEKYISIDLIEKYSYKWNYCDLSKNPNLTEEFILKYPYKNWDIEYLFNYNRIIYKYTDLSYFKNISEFIIENHKFPKNIGYLDYQEWNLLWGWDWEWLIENTDFNLEKCIPKYLVEKYLNKLDYRGLSYNIDIKKEFILKYPYKNWDIEYLIDNNKITDFNALTKFKNIKQNIIDKYPDKLWDWEWLIENTDINVEKYISIYLIEKYLIKWNYKKLGRRIDIKKEFILKYPYKNWDIEYLIDNDRITDFNALTKFKNIKQNIIDKYPNKPWDWEWLIENTDIKLEKYISINLIEKYPYKWVYQKLSYNPNITEEFILKYPYENWNIKYLIDNKIINNEKFLKLKFQQQNILFTN